MNVQAQLHGFLGVPVTCKDFLGKTAEKIPKSDSYKYTEILKNRTQIPPCLDILSFYKIRYFLANLISTQSCKEMISALFHVYWLGELPAEVAGMCKKKFQRNPATQTKESLLLQSKLGQTALVLLLKNWLTLGRAEVKRFCRHLAIVPWLGVAFLPFKVSYTLQFQI